MLPSTGQPEGCCAKDGPNRLTPTTTDSTAQLENIAPAQAGGNTPSRSNTQGRGEDETTTAEKPTRGATTDVFRFTGRFGTLSTTRVASLSQNDVPGDGDCALHVILRDIVEQHEGTTICQTVQELRMTMVKVLEDHGVPEFHSLEEGQFNLECGTEYEAKDVTQYCAQMSKNGIFLNDTEFMALTKVFPDYTLAVLDTTGKNTSDEGRVPVRLYGLGDDQVIWLYRILLANGVPHYQRLAANRTEQAALLEEVQLGGRLARAGGGTGPVLPRQSMRNRKATEWFTPSEGARRSKEDPPLVTHDDLPKILKKRPDEVKAMNVGVTKAHSPTFFAVIHNTIFPPDLYRGTEAKLLKSATTLEMLARKQAERTGVLELAPTELPGLPHGELGVFVQEGKEWVPSHPMAYEGIYIVDNQFAMGVGPPPL